METWSHILAGMVLAMGAVVAVGAEPPPPKAAEPSVKSVSGPFTHGNLTIFLLHGADVLPNKPILTLQEGLAQKTAVVHETSQVNELSVENTSADAMLFIQSGDIVKGGKQDRAIAFDLLLPPKSGKVALGSFCVEHGRWTQRGLEPLMAFGASTEQVTGKDLKAAVVGNNAAKQGEVWDEVRKSQQRLAKNVGGSVQSADSPSSLQLSLENKQVQDKVAAYEKALATAPDGKNDVIGMALCINGKVEGAEVYGSAALFRKLWPKLLKSAATDALAQLDEKKKFEPVTAKAVETFLAEAAAGPAKEVAMEARPTRQQLLPNQPALRGTIPAEPPAAGALAPVTRVRIVRYDAAKSVCVESQDKDAPAPTVIHRCYVAK